MPISGAANALTMGTACGSATALRPARRQCLVINARADVRFGTPSVRRHDLAASSRLDHRASGSASTPVIKPYCYEATTLAPVMPTRQHAWDGYLGPEGPLLPAVGTSTRTSFELAEYSYEEVLDGSSGRTWGTARDVAETLSDVAEGATRSVSGKVKNALQHLPAWQATVALCAGANIICSTMRGAMSVSVFPMSSMYGWSDSFTSEVSSSFFLGFTMSSLLGALVSRKASPSTLLTVGVAGTAMFTALTPLAASVSADSGAQLLATRLLTGMSEGLLYPGLQGMISQHVPKSNRAQALGLCYSGAEVGNVVSLTTSPGLIQWFGMASNFQAYSALGITWVATWLTLSGSLLSPDSDAEAKPQTAEPAAAESQGSSLSLRDLAGSKAYLSSVASHCTYQLGNVVSLALLPTYFAQEYGADMNSSAALSVTPWIFSIGAANFAGWLSDHMVAKEILSAEHTRKLMQTASSGGPALCLISLATSQGDDQSVLQAMLTMTTMISLMQFKAGGYGPNFMELSPKNASMLVGTSTFAAGLFGTGGLMLTGAALSQFHCWSLVFGTMAALQLASLSCFLKYGSTKPQFDE